jgi:two-component system, response regulator PdtaR
MATQTLYVVVAEDEPDTREYLVEVLARRGFRASGVAGGRELVEACRAEPPDLEIADVRMPGLDGVAAAEAITRERPVPVILLTGHYEEALLARVPADHIMGYLIKPVHEPDLHAAIALALARFREQRALEEGRPGEPAGGA